jgi:SAM-dependent methyltransferase
MGNFAADWLALREPADARARSRRLSEQLVTWLGARPGDGPVAVLDLGCGRGSNLRWLAPRLGGDQHWICLDRDPTLLGALIRETGTWAAQLEMEVRPRPDGARLAGRGAAWEVETRALDLADGITDLGFRAGTLVTASALLDLVGEEWLDSLVRQVADRDCPQLYALSYDGRVTLEPREPLDGLVIALINGHQRRDKGLGPALGPSAARRLLGVANGLGLVSASEDSDWVLEPGETAIQGALIDGWSEAALEQAAAAVGTSAHGARRRTESIEQWRAARLAHLAAGRSRIRVGHQDILLLPP